MARARKRKKGREGVGRDAIEFFFFFFSKRLCSWHTLRDIEPVSLFQKAHSSFAPLRTLAASPSIGTPRGALASSEKGPQRGEKKGNPKGASFFSSLLAGLPSLRDAAPRRRQRCPSAARIEAASSRNSSSSSRAAGCARPRGQQQQQQAEVAGTRKEGKRKERGQRQRPLSRASEEERAPLNVGSGWLLFACLEDAESESVREASQPERFGKAAGLKRPKLLGVDWVLFIQKSGSGGGERR